MAANAVVRRSWRIRPWIPDALVAVATLAVAIIARPPPFDRFLQVNQGAGYWGVLVAACAVLVFRRRAPALVWLAVIGLTIVGVLIARGPTSAIAPALVANFTLAARTDRRTAIWSGLLAAVAITIASAVQPGMGWASPIVYAMLAWIVMSSAVGDASRSRREIIKVAQERALRAEQSREEEAQRRVTEERVRIARELHDVIAHHIAVINVQAGVAEHLLASDPPKARESLSHVRDSSRLVLSELATMLGLLRTDTDHSEATAVNVTPAPRITDVAALVDSFRVSGLAADLSISGHQQDLPSSVELATYRLIQEALTNAHKHGSGSASVSLTYTPQALDITVVNPTRANTASDGQKAAGEGFGMIGMRERVGAAGGWITAGPDGASRFVVQARLPVTIGSTAKAAQSSFSRTGGDPMAAKDPVSDTAGTQ